MTSPVAEPPKPANLDEAHAALLTMLPAEQIEGLKSGFIDTSLLHHGLGTFIRNKWIRHGQLGRAFAGLNLGSIDAMSAIVLESFVCKLRGQPFDLKMRGAEVSAAENLFWASQKKPDAVSLADGAEIKWVVTRGNGLETVHTGFSISDKTCWRWVYGSSGRVDPATHDETAHIMSLDCVRAYGERS